MTSEITREKVQEILDRNAAEARRKEANLDAQERKLRLHINDNHAIKTAPKASERPQNKPEVEEVPHVQAEAVPLSRREQEAAGCHSWYQFMFMVFAPLLLVSMLVSLADGAPIAIPLLILMVAYTCMLLVMSIIAFVPKTARAEIKQFIRSLN